MTILLKPIVNNTIYIIKLYHKDFVDGSVNEGEWQDGQAHTSQL